MSCSTALHPPYSPETRSSWFEYVHVFAVPIEAGVGFPGVRFERSQLDCELPILGAGTELGSYTKTVCTLS